MRERVLGVSTCTHVEDRNVLLKGDRVITKEQVKARVAQRLGGHNVNPFAAIDQLVDSLVADIAGGTADAITKAQTQFAGLRQEVEAAVLEGFREAFVEYLATRTAASTGLTPASGIGVPASAVPGASTGTP